LGLQGIGCYGDAFAQGQRGGGMVQAKGKDSHWPRF
jgi:hypothetical protein